MVLLMFADNYPVHFIHIEIFRINYFALYKQIFNAVSH